MLQRDVSTVQLSVITCILYNVGKHCLWLPFTGLYILLLCSLCTVTHMFVIVIRPASTHMDDSCLIFGLCLNSLSVFTQQHHALPSCLSPVTSQIQDELSPLNPMTPSPVNQKETFWRMSLSNPTASFCIDSLYLSSVADETGGYLLELGKLESLPMVHRAEVKPGISPPSLNIQV